MKTITRTLLTSTAACFALPALAQNVSRDRQWEEPKNPPLEESGQRTRMAAAATETESDKRNGFRRIEEVIVTAQKRDERLQDVPISISVLGGEDLDGATVQGVTDALSRVAGVAVEESVQGGTTQLTVRGVSAAYGVNTGSSPIGYYLDSVPFGFVRSATVPDPDVYDLDRIEVLRGPQGTLYGANSMNGVVRVLTQDANLDDFELKARGLTSNTKYGDWNYRGDMAVNVPIVDGKLAARAVLGYQDLSGWIDKPTKKDANDAKRRNGRFKLGAALSERLLVKLSAWMSHDDLGSNALSDSHQQDPAPDTESIRTDFETYSADVVYDFSTFSLTSATSYIDYFNSGFQANNLSGGGLGTEMSAKTLTEELSASSTLKGAWRWTAGAIYRDGQDRRFNTIPGLLLPQSVKFTSESWAVFGELTRSFINGALELTGGVRYFEDDVGLQEESRLGNVQPAQYVTRQNKFDATTPRLILTWKPKGSLTIYASYSEGFRSGAEQLPSVLVAVPNLPPADPDKLKNYEIGSKGSLGPVGFDMAVYYVDWQDVQLPLVVEVENTPRLGLLNGRSASGVGADLSLSANLATGLTVGVSGSWNDLKMDADALAGTVVAYRKGDRLNASPEYTGGVSADYVFPIGGAGLEGRLSGAFNLTSVRTFQTLVGTQLRVTSSDRIGVGRLSFAVDSPDHWAATLFVDNINNEQGAVSAAFTQGTADFRPDSAMRLRPRTIGLQVDYRF